MTEPAASVGLTTAAGALTVKTAALLVTPEAEAVMLEVRAEAPVFAPVAKPEALIEAADALLDAHVNVMPDMFAPNWSAKAEYQYYDFGRTTFVAGPPAIVGTSFKNDEHTVKAGLNYRFTWGGPQVPRY